MFSIFKKWFCLHEWETHVKQTYTWDETKMIRGTEHWITPKWVNTTCSETIEILICKKCGKIHRLEY